MKKLFSSSLLLAFLAQGQGRLTPARINQEIKQSGAKAVVAQLSANGEREWNFVTREISSGRNDWLDLAPALAPGTDASTAIGLRYALSRALPRAPSRVLTILRTNKAFTVEDVCDVPYIEPSKQIVDTYLKQAKSAVSKVNDPALTDVRKACLNRLNN